MDTDVFLLPFNFISSSFPVTNRVPGRDEQVLPSRMLALGFCEVRAVSLSVFAYMDEEHLHEYEPEDQAISETCHTVSTPPQNVAFVFVQFCSPF